MTLRNLSAIFLYLSLGACTSEIGGGNPAIDAGTSSQVDAMVGAVDAMPIAPKYTVYLSVGGESVTAGQDDASANSSQIISGAPIDIPGLDPTDYLDSHTRAEITSALATRVNALVSEFAIEVVTSRPSSGDYNMIIIGGTPAAFGFPGTVLSVSPSDCNNANIDSPIGFVMSGNSEFFTNVSNNYDAQLEHTSILIAQTMGFGLGLEQVTNCSDIMGWQAGNCDNPSFLDQDSTCSSQPCNCGGGANANSAQLLRTALGL